MIYLRFLFFFPSIHNQDTSLHWYHALVNFRNIRFLINFTCSGYEGKGQQMHCYITDALQYSPPPKREWFCRCDHSSLVSLLRSLSLCHCCIIEVILIDIRKSLFSDWENSAVITGWEALLTNKQTGHVTLLYIFLFIYLFIFRMKSQGQTGLHRGTSCKQFTLWALKTDQPAPEWVTPTVSISTTETHSHRSAWRPPSSSR